MERYKYFALPLKCELLRITNCENFNDAESAEAENYVHTATKDSSPATLHPPPRQFDLFLWESQTTKLQLLLYFEEATEALHSFDLHGILISVIGKLKWGWGEVVFGLNTTLSFS